VPERFHIPAGQVHGSGQCARGRSEPASGKLRVPQSLEVRLRGLHQDQADVVRRNLPRCCRRHGLGARIYKKRMNDGESTRPQPPRTRPTWRSVRPPIGRCSPVMRSYSRRGVNAAGHRPGRPSIRKHAGAQDQLRDPPPQSEERGRGAWTRGPRRVRRHAVCPGDSSPARPSTSQIGNPNTVTKFTSAPTGGINRTRKPAHPTILPGPSAVRTSRKIPEPLDDSSQRATGDRQTGGRDTCVRTVC